MDQETDDRLRALAESVADLARRQAEIERRLSLLERLTMKPAPALTPPLPPAPVAVPAPARKEPRAELETRVGLTWVNRIGVVTLVLGVAFFFKYAVDNSWIGETGRVMLGVAAGVAALVAGERIWRSGQRVYAQGISGAGIAILYVSFFAAASFYRVLSVSAGFALMTAVTILTGALAVRYRAPAMAALGLTGGYLTPVVFDAARNQPWFFLAYVLMLDLGAVALARIRNWRSLEWLALPATYLLLATATRVPPAGRGFVLSVFTLLYAALYTALPGRALQALARGAGLAWMWVLWRDATADVPDALALIVLAALLAAAQFYYLPRARELTTYAAGLGVSLLVLASPALVSDYRITICWALCAVVLSWSGWKSATARLTDAALAVLLFVALRLSMVEAAAARGPRFAAFTISAGAFWAAAHRLGMDWRALAVYVAGHMSMLWVLGAEVLDWARRTARPENLTSVRSASISILIAAYAVVLIGVGVATRSLVNRALGLVLIAVVVVKLYLYDVWQLSRIYRFSAFAMLGLLLLLASYLYSHYGRFIRSSLQGLGRREDVG